MLPHHGMQRSVFALVMASLCLTIGQGPVWADGFNLLHSFGGGAGDGSGPRGSLTLDGTTLYGMTDVGGANAEGAIFKMNTNGTGYTNLHEFAGGPATARIPMGI